MKPLAIDLYCGLGGWTEGLLAEGYEVVGFDIERHVYPVPEMPEGALDERRKAASGTKAGGDWFGTYVEEKARGTISPTRLTGKGTTARKAASAQIAKIPFELARYIAATFKP
jgi:hypothetical protein